MATLDRANPTPVNVHNMLPEGTVGGTNATAVQHMTVIVSVPQSTANDGTANAGWISWVNPEPTTIIVTDVHVYVSATATGGTIDVGVSDDGTGSDDTIIKGGTLDSLVRTKRHYAADSTTAGTAGTAGYNHGWILGPGGTGTNNSIVGKNTEVTSTAAGFVVITYLPLTS